MPSIKNFQISLQFIFQELIASGCLNRAAGLAFVTLLSLVPLLTVSFSILYAFPIFKILTLKLLNLVLENFIAISATTIQGYLQTFINQTARLSEIGMIVLVVTAVLLVFSMEQAFNAIWHVRRNRKGITAFFLYWGVITIVPILVVGVIWQVNYFIALPWLANLHVTSFDKMVSFCMPYIITWLAFSLLYYTLPNCKVPPRSAMLAALVAVILFELSRKCFALYIAYFASYQEIYGALALIPIFLVWLYISWVVILFGVVVCYAITQKLND